MYSPTPKVTGFAGAAALPTTGVSIIGGYWVLLMALTLIGAGVAVLTLLPKRVRE
jgi:hypothetical protein